MMGKYIALQLGLKNCWGLYIFYKSRLNMKPETGCWLLTPCLFHGQVENCHWMAWLTGWAPVSVPLTLLGARYLLPVHLGPVFGVYPPLSRAELQE